MKAFVALAFLQIFAFANCGSVEKITEFGKKGEHDILIYTAGVSLYKPTIDRYEYVEFPPKGLINPYTVTYVKVLDYNPSTADVSKYSGNVGTPEIAISLKAPVLKRIEATVEIYGTYNGPCDSTNTKKPEEASTKKPEDEKYVFQ